MHLYLSFGTLLPLLAIASPMLKRAGGPAIVPIPKNCTVINPLPHANCGKANANSYMVNTTFNTEHQVYAAYFQEPFLSPAAQGQQCVEQCNGLYTCKSALLAYNVPVPAGFFGTPGGNLVTACLMFDEYLSPHKFVVAPSGEYVNETAGNIYCPS